LWEHPIEEGIARARGFLDSETGRAETLDALAEALACIDARESPDAAITRIGEGWVAEEALAIALYCAMAASDFAAGVRMAVNHDGDSDTTGSLAGQLLGAKAGESTLPAEWLQDLEMRGVITRMADDLSGFQSWDLDGDPQLCKLTARRERYPPW
jgi:hypothetical protein